ncbi:MAG: ComF family protein [Candidatus Peribacteraceae bacterium]|nr:ComF family protein [Candidatus Peribacteraceae bacterium]
MLKPLLDLLFPIPSLDGGEGQWITEDEWTSLANLESIYLTQSQLRKMGCTDLETVIAAADYETSPLLRKAIRTLKYKRIPALSHMLSFLMINAASNLLMLPGESTPVLCPIPLHWTRRFQRGFNQAQLLAADIGREKNWPVEQLIVRTRPTGHQAWRNREQRLKAVNNAFQIHARSLRSSSEKLLTSQANISSESFESSESLESSESFPAPATVILVDDLLTTGATMQACAAALKKAGIKRVIGLTVARG